MNIFSYTRHLDLPTFVYFTKEMKIPSWDSTRLLIIQIILYLQFWKHARSICSLPHVNFIVRQCLVVVCLYHFLNRAAADKGRTTVPDYIICEVFCFYRYCLWWSSTPEALSPNFCFTGTAQQSQLSTPQTSGDCWAVPVKQKLVDSASGIELHHKQYL